MAWTRAEPRMDEAMRKAIDQIMLTTMDLGPSDLPTPVQDAVNALVNTYLRPADDTAITVTLSREQWDSVLYAMKWPLTGAGDIASSEAARHAARCFDATMAMHAALGHEMLEGTEETTT